MEDNTNVKHIQLFETLHDTEDPTSATTTAAGTKKKKITETAAWKDLKYEEFMTDSQWKMINDAAKYYKYIHPNSNIYRRASDDDLSISSGAQPPPHYSLVLSQIQQKLYGYKNQDILKNKYNAAKFITVDGVFSLFLREDMRCYYCHKVVLLLYEFIREQKQWSLDRIDNSMGHNNDNLYLACLSCNLRRRCLYPEKYVMTQKCMNVIRLPAAVAAAASEDSSATTTETNTSEETTPTVRSRSPSFGGDWGSDISAPI
jgi:hypothetical protein